MYQAFKPAEMEKINKNLSKRERKGTTEQFLRLKA